MRCFGKATYFITGDTNMKWISVKDKVPEANQPVLCCNDENEMFVAEFFRLPFIGPSGHFDRWDSGHCCGREPKEPTHWMPLPNKPGN
jgi:Protein of unknown function (DUF551)